MEKSIQLNADYWNKRYLNQETGWDIGYPSTPIVKLIDQLTNKNTAILIPGAGNAYEAAYLIEQGFNNITIVDFAASVCEKLALKFQSEKDKINIINADFFELEGQFDLIIEQTFFCAIDPSKRKNYVQKMKELLAPNGSLQGLLFNTNFETGPPFGGSISEYQSLFEAHFAQFHWEESQNSIPPRQGKEIWFSVRQS